jgi:transposase-like protein
MPRTRRTYTPEFKAEAVKLVTEQGSFVAEAARSLGIQENLLRNWKHAPRTRASTPSPATVSPPPSRRRTAASGPRTSGSWRSGTS